MDKSKLLIDFLLERPFFGVILSQTELIPRKNIPTMSTNGRYIYYNPDWVETLSYYEIMGILAHEVLHIAFLHHVRCQNRDHIKWNIACDMAINPLLIENGFVVVNGCLFDHENPPRSAEEIYETLPDIEYEYTPYGEVVATYECTDDEETERVTLLIGRALAQSAGKLSRGLTRTFEEILNPPIPWKNILSNYLTKVITTDYSSNRHSRRFVNKGLYLPSLYKKSVDLVVVVDTSGSIDDQQLAEMLSVINDLRSQIDVFAKVFYCDAEIVGEEFFEPDDPVSFDFNPAGGGGTDFRPVFEKLIQEDEIPSVLVYLTDGFCDTYPDKNLIEFPVIWVYFRDDVHIDMW